VGPAQLALALLADHLAMTGPKPYRRSTTYVKYALWQALLPELDANSLE